MMNRWRLEGAIICHNPDYDFSLQDLIGAVGGYLGLFLGWSVMSIVTAAPAWITLVTGLVCKGRREYNVNCA